SRISHLSMWFLLNALRGENFASLPGQITIPSQVRGLSTDLSEKSSKTFCCPASPSARRTASWKSLNEYRTIAGGVSAPFDNMVTRSLVAARTSASGWELTQRGSHHPRTVAVE